MNIFSSRGTTRTWFRSIVAPVAAALAVTIATASMTAAATPVAAGTQATITVNGHGSVSVVPDAAQATIGVTVMNESLSEAQAEATSSMQAILDAIREQGVADEDIQTAAYWVQVYQSYDERGAITGVQQFQITNQVAVTIRDIDAVGALLDAAVAAGANAIQGVGFLVTDPSAAAAQARQLAIEDARVRAEQLAAAAGLSLGSVVSISESFGPSPMPVGRGGAGAAMDAAVPIEIGTSAVTVDVVVVYELVA